MAAGVPVVARDLPVLREVMGDAALYAATVPDLAAQLRVAAGPRDLARARAGRETAGRYTWAAAAQAHLALYGRSVGGGGGGAHRSGAGRPVSLTGVGDAAAADADEDGLFLVDDGREAQMRTPASSRARRGAGAITRRVVAGPLYGNREGATDNNVRGEPAGDASVALGGRVQGVVQQVGVVGTEQVQPVEQVQILITRLLSRRHDLGDHLADAPQGERAG